jgi:CxxC motif-containing protein (DUF1111 family)
MSRILLAVLLLWAVGCTDDRSVTAPDQPEDRPVGEDLGGIEPELSLRGLKDAHTPLSGGTTTVFDVSADAFSFPIPTLQGEDLERHDEGDEEFEIEFVSAPAAENAGLGPVFDNVSCEACHVGDGRGRPPFGADPFSSLFRASVAGSGPNYGPAPVPGFGGQLQLRSIQPRRLCRGVVR